MAKPIGIPDTIVIEDKQFDFLSAELPRPTNFIRRFQQNFNRFYYNYKEDGSIVLYSSATTLIKDGYAEDTIFLEKWRNALKAEGKNPEYELAYLAMRGTLMHFLLGDFIQGKDIPLVGLRDYIFANAPELTTKSLFEDVLSKDNTWLVKGILAFGQFVRDYNVKPLALELIMASEKYKVASPIDMICSMDIEEKGFFGEVYKTGEKKGQPKESKQVRTIIAVVDFKSGNFYDKHYLQLQLYKRIIKENYPDLKVEGLYNWSPKDWSSTPTYNLKEQSDGRLDALCECIFEQGRIKHAFKTPTVDFFMDSVSMNSYDGTSAFKKIPLIDYLKQLHGERSETTE